MGKLIYSMNVSLDGFVDTPTHSLDWVRMDDELHAWFNDEARESDAFLYGRRLYEVMAAYWPTAESDPAATPVEIDFARIWNPKPKVVFSRTLDRVEWNSRLARGEIADELARLRTEFSGDLSVGGPTLASAFIERGLVDEYRVVVHPVAIGAGTPFFPAGVESARPPAARDADVRLGGRAPALRRRPGVSDEGRAGAMRVGISLPVGEHDGRPGHPLAWSDVRDVALAAEAAGLDSAWLADHFMYRDPAGEITGLHEAWTLLSALASVTSRIELGTLVLCGSFRNPGLVAKMAATADLVADGRIVLGLGAGWHDPEYEMFGYPIDHRVGRFEEHLEIVARLLHGERVSMSGRYHEVRDAVLVPPPTRRVPVLVAAESPRMLRLAARWADAWVTAWYGPASDEVRARLRAFDEALAVEGRAGDAVARVVGVTVRDDDQPPVAEPEANAIGGSIDDVARALEAYAGLGFDQVIVGLEPISARSVERLAIAVRRHRGVGG